MCYGIHKTTFIEFSYYPQLVSYLCKSKDLSNKRVLLQLHHEGWWVGLVQGVGAGDLFQESIKWNHSKIISLFIKKRHSHTNLYTIYKKNQLRRRKKTEYILRQEPESYNGWCVF